MRIKELIALHTPPVKYLMAWALWQRGEIAKLRYGHSWIDFNAKAKNYLNIYENDLMLIDKAVTQLSMISSREHALLVNKYVHGLSIRRLKEIHRLDDNRYYRLLDNATTHFYQNLLKLIED